MRLLHYSVRFVHSSRMCHRADDGYGTDSNSSSPIANDAYVTVDLVINVAARGLVLCFIHCLGPNTIACGRLHAATTYSLYSRLLEKVEQSSDMNCAFQILLDIHGIRSLAFSWPPTLPQEYSRSLLGIAENVALDNPYPDITNCARRRKTRRTIYPSNDVAHVIESVLVPYGK